MSTKKCGYCRENGHNIKSCNHSSCITLKRVFEQNIYASTYCYVPNMLKNHLESLNVLEIKLIASQCYNLKSSDAKKIIMDKIMDIQFPEINMEKQNLHFFQINQKMPETSRERLSVYGPDSIIGKSIAQGYYKPLTDFVQPIQTQQTQTQPSQPPIITRQTRTRYSLRNINRINYSGLESSRIRSNNSNGRKNKPKIEGLLVNTRSMSESVECPICFENTTQKVVSNCDHSFCFNCISKYIKNKNYNCDCPMCRVKINSLKTNNNDILQKIINI